MPSLRDISFRLYGMRDSGREKEVRSDDSEISQQAKRENQAWPSAHASVGPRPSRQPTQQTSALRASDTFKIFMRVKSVSGIASD